MMTMVCVQVFGQLSPGDLSEAHAHLEGLSNCTQCHILGEKVSNEKCLDCHQTIKTRIDQKKGYHSSTEIAGKECIICHSDHHGRKFEMIRFDKQNFDHTLTGYQLLGAHNNQTCEKCHKTKFIANNEIKKKKNTFLGLEQQCISCHADYHQNTLSTSCLNCHTNDHFKPASKFDHNKTNYQLLGKHQEIDCNKCHVKEIRNGSEFQVFKGIEHANCNSCHQDIHNNKFGQDCKKCHSEQSFLSIIGISTFDHSRTNFQLEGPHRYLKCEACHKTKYTDPIRHIRCADCHDDYHNNQFAKQGSKPDCIMCHNKNSFSNSNFTIEQHNEGNFQLQGAHLAIPCFECHKKEDNWNFRNIGEQCSDCHTDVHKDYISNTYYPEENCEYCHSLNNWREVNKFNHSLTKFELTGEHKKLSCRNCHFKNENGVDSQRFRGLPTECVNCHTDIHSQQFEKEGITNCTSCHNTTNWLAGLFDHNNARFKLDGKHKDVACFKCHKPVITGQKTYIKYKFNDFRCEVCHQ